MGKPTLFRVVKNFLKRTVKVLQQKKRLIIYTGLKTKNL